MAHVCNKNGAGMGMIHLVRLVHPRALRIDEHALAALEAGGGTLDCRAVGRVGIDGNRSHAGNELCEHGLE